MSAVTRAINSCVRPRGAVTRRNAESFPTALDPDRKAVLAALVII
jgi:hypothetical protein